ncbi:zinc metalloproteinase nas-4-like [Sitodiplosis mosellana]|uniref:zinc metalloproteinase nas-4-like n=1 Tax=Sitodiplosis mosellana TaxID=263140 RepID=UPI002445085F|nr:zinc metalloproteinase nas-4-like [Sitodiplosis mosellana]
MKLLNASFAFVLLHVYFVFHCDGTKTKEVKSTEGSSNEKSEHGQHIDLFQGDILLTQEQRDALNGNGPKTRNGLTDIRFRWPNNIVVFEFASSMSFEGKEIILYAMRRISRASCILFKRRDNEVGFVEITATHHGCFSQVSYSGKKQTLNFGSDCTYRNACHELLHREDQQFQKYDRSLVSHMGGSYDYHSIMHYSGTAFSVDTSSKWTILSKDPNVQESMGRSQDLSKSDVMKLNYMYRCHGNYNIL